MKLKSASITGKITTGLIIELEQKQIDIVVYFELKDKLRRFLSINLGRTLEQDLYEQLYLRSANAIS